MTLRRALAQGLMLFGSSVLVQVPAKDVRLDDPGSNDPPIARFKVSSQLRCVPVAQLTPKVGTPSP